MRQEIALRGLQVAGLCGIVRFCTGLCGNGDSPRMTEQNLSSEESHAIASLIREELARRRITRQFLADRAKISLSTLEKALSGQRPLTLATVIRLEEALGVKLRKANDAHARLTDVAPDTLGSYARPAVAWIEGDYLTLRPSFSTAGAIYAYRTSISWSDKRGHLIFREAERLDTAFTQEGDVSIPHQSGYVYLVTNKAGQYRLIIVTRPTITGEMFGILTTLQSGRGAHLVPVSCPIVLTPLKDKASFGRIETGQSDYKAYRSLVDRAVDEPFALLVGR
jgi:transcriptional regulator with XRE-family HTH domain